VEARSAGKRQGSEFTLHGPARGARRDAVRQHVRAPRMNGGRSALIVENNRDAASPRPSRHRSRAAKGGYLVDSPPEDLLHAGPRGPLPCCPLGSDGTGGRARASSANTGLLADLLRTRGPPSLRTRFSVTSSPLLLGEQRGPTSEPWTSFFIVPISSLGHHERPC